MALARTERDAPAMLHEGRMMGWLTLRTGPLLLTKERYFFRFRWGLLSQYLTEDSSAVQRYCLFASALSVHRETRKILILFGPLGVLSFREPHSADKIHDAWGNPDQESSGSKAESRRYETGDTLELWGRKKRHLRSRSSSVVSNRPIINEAQDCIRRRKQDAMKRLVLIADTDEELYRWAALFENARMRSISERYEVHSCLGRGASGDVILASLLANPSEQVALKRIEYQRPCQNNDAKQLLRIYKEIQIQSKAASHCASPALVYDVFFDFRYVYVVMEYVQGGTLSQWIASNAHISEDVAICIAGQVAQCIMMLHQHNMVHRDIKADNCLVELDDRGLPFKIRLIDFGFAEVCIGGHGTNMTNFCFGFLGTASYMAPEIESFERYGAPVDMFALGVLVHLLLLRAYPFDADSLEETLHLIKEGDTDMLRSETSISDDAKSFCLALLNKDPCKRLTATAALQHRWIRKGRNVTENAMALPGTDRSPRAWFRRIFLVITVAQALLRWSSARGPAAKFVSPAVANARRSMLKRLDAANSQQVFRHPSTENFASDSLLSDIC